MKTHRAKGQLYGPEDLVSGFKSRLDSLEWLAEGFERLKNDGDTVPRYVFSALAAGLMNLQEDFGMFEDALNEWLDNPEELRKYAEEAEERRNETAGGAR